MNERHTITEVKVVNDKILFLKFSDGSHGSFNFDDYFTYKGILEPLKEQRYFGQVHLSQGTIAWPNECDLCPDVLYSIITKEKIIVNGKLVFDPTLGKNAWL